MTDFPFKDSERVILETRKHWFVFARNALFILGYGLTILIAATILSAFSFPTTTEAATVMLLASGFWLLIVWILLFFAWTTYYLERWIVTDRCLVHIYQAGFTVHKEVAVLIENVREIELEKQSILQSAFNYGSIRLRSVDNQTIEGLPQPEAFRSAIFQQIAGIEELTATTIEQEKLLRTVSHEVKGYLAKNAMAFASIAEGDYGAVSDPLKEMTGSALADTRKGVEMLMDMLASSDFKTGHVRFEARAFDMKDTTRAIIDEQRPEAEKKGLSLEYVVDEGTYTLVGDEEKMRQFVLHNLISNAIHYTKEGYVRVLLTKVDTHIVLAVSDSGIGMDKEQLQKLFAPGNKGSGSSLLNPTSTGYGLYIARTVANAHGGTMWAQSAGVGKGSQFYTILPSSIAPTVSTA